MLLLTYFLFSLSVEASEWKFSANGDLKFLGNRWSAATMGPDSEQYRGVAQAKFPTTLRRGRSFRIRALPLVQWDPQSPSSKERFYWDFPEAFLQYQNLPWTIQLGLNVHTWGDTDVFNPLDVVNPRRYWDPFQSEKIGTPALSVKRDFGDLFLEALYIPQQRKSLVPGEKSRWLPRDIYRVRTFAGFGTPTRLILPANLNYSYTDDVEVDKALSNNFALRAKFRLPNFDGTLMTYRGASPSPDVRPRFVSGSVVSIAGGETTFQADPNFVLQRAYYPVQVSGLSFTWATLGILVKGAGAYTQVRNQRFDLPARVWESVLGLEKSLSLGSGSLTLLAQGTSVNRGDALDSNSVSLARMFDRSAMGALRWSPSERWTVTASLLRDLKFKGSLWHFEAGWKFTDGWRADISGDFLSGRPETPLGTYARNDRVTASLGWQF
jgi:hypothetical protein